MKEELGFAETLARDKLLGEKQMNIITIHYHFGNVPFPHA